MTTLRCAFPSAGVGGGVPLNTLVANVSALPGDCRSIRARSAAVALGGVGCPLGIRSGGSLIGRDVADQCLNWRGIGGDLLRADVDARSAHQYLVFFALFR